MRPVDPRLLRYARASRGFFIAIAALSLAQTAVIVSFAWLLTQAIVGIVEGGGVRSLGPVLLGLAGVVTVRGILLWARDTVAARAAARVQTQLRTALVDAVDRLGPEWLGTRNSAQLTVTAGRGLDALEAYFGRYLPQLVQTVIATPLVVAVIWWQDWISGLTVALTIPLIPIFMVLIGMLTRVIQRKQWETLGQLAARFADTVQGLATLKIYGRQHRTIASIARVTDTYRGETMRVLRVSFLSGFMLEFLASIAVAIVAVSIGFRLLDGVILLTVGLFVLLLAPEAYLPLRQVGVQFHAAAEGVAATDDVFAVLDADRARTDPERGRSDAASAPSRFDAEAHRLTLQDVRVRRGERVMPPVSLHVVSGQVVLLSGPSGVGKSSLFAALRGAAVFSGHASFDGVDLGSLAPAAWLAWAGQRPGLIAGSIASNIALGDDAPDDSAASALVRRALDLAGAAELDQAQPLGVQGAGLSGGQAQRVAVARAIFRHLRGAAPVLALDEPSAALDADTEALLWRSLRSLADAGALVLLISHRPSAREIADVTVELRPSEVSA